jgi:hypothetical protein
MILGADLVQQLSKRYVHSPSDIFPVLPHRTKLNWFRALPTIGLGDSDSRNPSIYEGKYQQIADKIGVGFELPNSISASVVPNVPKMAVEQAEQAVA